MMYFPCKDLLFCFFLTKVFLNKQWSIAKRPREITAMWDNLLLSRNLRQANEIVFNFVAELISNWNLIGWDILCIHVYTGTGMYMR